MEAPKTIQHEIGGVQNDALRVGPCGVKSDLVGSNPLQSAHEYVKKDHSKIQTAQDVSIEIAREFFYLQDMLGFDEPSKTIEWLLTKSREAIKEPVNMKHGGSRSLFDEDEDVDSSELEGTNPKSNSPDQDAVSKEIKMKRLHKAKL